MASSKKRENCLDWEEYFMAVAKLAAQRSKDPSLQVGACLVTKDNKIISIGYNGMPIGCSDDDFPWGKGTENHVDDNKHLYVCHAEMNAILLNENPANVKNSTMYVTLFPCNECAKIIIQAGIRKVVYLSDEKGHKKEFIAAKEMFDAADINYTMSYMMPTTGSGTNPARRTGVRNSHGAHFFTKKKPFIPKTERIEINWNRAG